jgi:nucleoside phosphorylase
VTSSSNPQVNAALTTQLLIDYFYVDKILHYGIAGGADASSNLGDVSIAAEWATWGLWSWQVRIQARPVQRVRKRTSPNPSLQLEP